MKRLAAIIASCMIITGAFASCGSKDSDSSSSAETSSAASSDASETTTEDQTEASASGTTSKTTTEAVTTKAVTTKAATTKASTTSSNSAASDITTEKKETPSVDASELKGGNIVGKWKVQDDYDEDMVFEFKADGNITFSADMSDMLTFKNGKAVISDTLEADTTFDGTTCTVRYMGEDFIIMKRTSGETSTTDMSGEYVVTGGEFLGMSGEMNSELKITISGEKTFMETDTFGKYTTDGNKLTVSEGKSADNTQTLTYGVIGNKFVTVDEYGNVDEMVRAD